MAWKKLRMAHCPSSPLHQHELSWHAGSCSRVDRRQQVFMKSDILIYETPSDTPPLKKKGIMRDIRDLCQA